jgi:cytochrome c oxidase cbb3-type subunit 3/ubiquinol-cytochrome c reductase cytochrome c subunit
MRIGRALELVLMLGLCVGSGDLECGRPLTSAQRRGQRLYDRMCVVCHGPIGEGYAADQAPALAHPDFLASATDDYIRSAISDGRRGTTMSAWSVARTGPLTRADVDAIVAFIRTWQRGSSVVLDERGPSGHLARGAAIFARECSSCHGPRGTSGPYIHVGGTELVATASNGFLRYAVRGGRRGTPMPGFDRSLGEAGIEDVVALLRSWQSAAVMTPLAPSPGKIPLGPLLLHPFGPEPVALRPYPDPTSADVVKGELDRHARMALLDARAPSDYLATHIAGAVSVPFYDADSYIPSLPKTAWLVCYCACPHAESGQLARKLVTSGFTKVTVLDEGLNVWMGRKYPTNSGMDP